jgi:hypothetical protein
MDPDALEMTDGEELLANKPEPIPFEVEKVDLERGDYVVDGVSSYNTMCEAHRLSFAF